MNPTWVSHLVVCHLADQRVLCAESLHVLLDRCLLEDTADNLEWDGVGLGIVCIVDDFLQVAGLPLLTDILNGGSVVVVIGDGVAALVLENLLQLGMRCFLATLEARLYHVDHELGVHFTSGDGAQELVNECMTVICDAIDMLFRNAVPGFRLLSKQLTDDEGIEITAQLSTAALLKNLSHPVHCTIKCQWCLPAGLGPGDIFHSLGIDLILNHVGNLLRAIGDLVLGPKFADLLSEPGVGVLHDGPEATVISLRCDRLLAVNDEEIIIVIARCSMVSLVMRAHTRRCDILTRRWRHERSFQTFDPAP